MTLTFDQYAEQAVGTAHYPGRDSGLGVIYCALAASNEAGELAGWAKKMWRDDGLELTPERKADLIKEAGDVLWYLTALAHELGVSLEAIGIANLRKLAERYPDRAIFVPVDLYRELEGLPGI